MDDLDALLLSNKITKAQHEIFVLFASTEFSYNIFTKMMYSYFMDEPNIDEMSGVGFAYYDGRRAPFRDIQRTIDFVKKALKELRND